MNNQAIDFNTYLDKWEDNLLARVLVAWKLVSQEQIKVCLQERATLPPQQRCKLGQFLIRKRALQISDYSRAMVLVRKQALLMYQRSMNGSQTSTLQTPQASHTDETQRVHPNSPQMQQQIAQQRKMQMQRQRQLQQRQQQVHAQGDQDSKILSPNETAQEHKKEVGSRFGSYEILHEVARGGMGIVYKAKQLYLNRTVALKVLLSGGAASEIEIQRFRREAEAAGSLQHPNIVSIYEIGQHEGYHYFTMDFIEGDTLQEMIKKKASKKKLIALMEKVARALHHAHQREVVHRDIKPSNIIVSKEGEPKITDFGLAKKLDADTMLTESGAALGTPFYMSPEQTLGNKDIDGRADIYSMGVILYEILAQRLPFNGTTLVELYHKIVEEDPIAPTKINRKVDKDLEVICLKCMEKDAERRYQTALELADDLKRYMEGDAISARRSSPVYRIMRKIKRHKNIITTSGGVLAIILAVVMFGIWRNSEDFGGLSFEEKKKLLAARDLLEEGRELIKDNKLDEALRKFEQAIQTYNKLKEAYIDKGDVYQAYRDYQRALNEYDRILKIDPQFAPAYVRKGHAYMGLRDWTEAIEQFTLAIKFNEEYIDAYQGRGEAYKNRGNKIQNSVDFENSIRDYEKAEQLKKALAKRKKTKSQEKNNYDSFLIAGGVLALLIAFVVFGIWSWETFRGKAKRKAA